MKALKVIGAPVHAAAKVIPHRQRVVIMSVVFLVAGPLIATIQLVGIPHFIFDSLGYLVHGCGCAPLVDKFLDNL